MSSVTGGVQYNGPCFNTKMVFYTAKDLGGDAITDEVVKGAVMCLDIANTTIPARFLNAPTVGHFSSPGSTVDLLGVAVTKPEDGGDGDNLSLFAGIVTEVPDGFDEAGWVEVVSGGDLVEALVNGATVLDPVTSLRPTSGQWYLSAETSSIASAAANLLALSRICAQPLVAQTTTSTRLVKCRVGRGGVNG